MFRWVVLLVLVCAFAACGLTQGKTADQQICQHVDRAMNAIVNNGGTDWQSALSIVEAENRAISALAQRARYSQIRDLAKTADFDNQVVTDQPADLIGPPTHAVTELSNECARLNL